MSTLPKTAPVFHPIAEDFGIRNPVPVDERIRAPWDVRAVDPMPLTDAIQWARWRADVVAQEIEHEARRLAARLDVTSENAARLRGQAIFVAFSFSALEARIAELRTLQRVIQMGERIAPRNP